MYGPEIDGRLQVTSAISLLEFSRLVHWDDNSAQFIPAQQGEFELSWSESVWPVFLPAIRDDALWPFASKS